MFVVISATPVRLGHAGCSLQRLENLQLAEAVGAAFALGEPAGDGIDVCEVVYPPSAGFEDDFVVAGEARERAVAFSREIGSYGLAV